jgi:hypothetical protein
MEITQPIIIPSTRLPSYVTCAISADAALDNTNSTMTTSTNGSSTTLSSLSVVAQLHSLVTFENVGVHLYQVSSLIGSRCRSIFITNHVCLRVYICTVACRLRMVHY